MSVVAHGLWKAFGANEVLRDVSLKLEVAQLTVLYGPSGSGKSTLLHMLTGLIRPDRGRVRVRSDHRGQFVALAPQGANCLPTRTAVDNVAISVMAQGVSRREARGVARRHLATVGLEDRADLAVRLLSGGELTRVALVRAIATDAALVAADEPTGNLDASSTQQVIEKLRSAVGLGAGLIVATHDRSFLQVADLVLRLEHGSIHEDT